MKHIANETYSQGATIVWDKQQPESTQAAARTVLQRVATVDIQLRENQLQCLQATQVLNGSGKR